MNALKHYGVLGMKWGRRRAKGGKASLRSKVEKGSQDYKKAKSLKGKKIKDMSNGELRIITNRMNLEFQYKTAVKNKRRSGRFNSILRKVEERLVNVGLSYGEEKLKNILKEVTSK